MWTSHFLRRGAATAAYANGVVLQKIKHFGGWAELSSIVLDYINSTALPCAVSLVRVPLRLSEVQWR